MTDRVRCAMLAFLTGTAIVLSGVVATAAFAADPSGCKGESSTIERDSAGRLHGHGSGKCDDYSLRFFTGEIKWDKNFTPDPLTASITSSDYQKYKVDVRSCDKGNRRSYYARSYWTSTRGYHDSPHVELDAC
jgi:hypothetical protein